MNEAETLLNLATGLANARATIVRVPVESTLEQREVSDRVRAWSITRGRPVLGVELGARDYRIDEEMSAEVRFVWCDMLDPFVDGLFAAGAGLDLVVEYAKVVSPFTMPEKPHFLIDPKGVEA